MESLSTWTGGNFFFTVSSSNESMGDFIAKHASPKKAVLMEGRTTDDAPKRFQAKLLSYLYNCQATVL